MKRFVRQKSTGTVAMATNIDFGAASTQIARVLDPAVYTLRIESARVVLSGRARRQGAGARQFGERPRRLMPAEAVFVAAPTARKKLRNVSIVEDIRPSTIGARNPSDRVTR